MKNNTYYKIGIDTTGRDIDGDIGWARNWSIKEYKCLNNNK